MTPPVLSAEALRVRIAGIEVLKGVSLAVSPGSIVAVIGANGAGKTTLMRTFAGQLPPASGTLRYEGDALTARSAHQLAQWGLSLVPEGRHIFPNLTVAENLRMGAITSRNKEEVRRRAATVEELFPRLTERLHQLGSSLSGGEQQMLAIGRALMSGPRVLLLDEPSLGLAPVVVKQIFRAVAQLANAGLTVLLVEQNARLALRLADYAYVLRLGEIVKEGPGRHLLTDEDVTRAYLGGTQTPTNSPVAQTGQVRG